MVVVETSYIKPRSSWLWLKRHESNLGHPGI